KTAPRMSTCYENVGTFYFGCSQSNELARDYKESNCLRMERFNCHGTIIIHIDMPAAKVTVKLKHEILHERSVDVTTPEEIKQAIQENIHMDPVQLRTYLYNKFDISKITLQQIRYWWSFFTQNFYKSDDDHVNSAYSFLKSNQAAGCELCYELITSQITAIGFITPFQKLKCRKKVQHVQYRPEDAATEFDFIDINFKPNLEDLENEICPQHLRQEVLNFIKMHFNQHSKIPVNAKKLYNPEGIRLVYSNFEWNTDYPFLTLKSSSNNLQNQHFNEQSFNEQHLNEQPPNERSLNEQSLNVNNKLSTQANIKNDLIITDENNKNFNPDLHQQCKSKVVTLERLVKHLNDELSANNLRHVKNVVDNMKRTFTIIDDIESSQRKRRCSNTWSQSKPWT
ncbi:1136_t:CDS:2, partial [Cetraspora pellucida]